MRICIVSSSYPPVYCGVGDFVQQLARALAVQDAEVLLLTTKERAIRPDDGKITILPVVPTWGWGALPLIMSHLSAVRPDIINIQYPTLYYGRQPMVNILPFFSRARLRIPTVTTVHEFSTFRRLGKWRVGLSVMSSTGVIVPDRANLTQMARAFPKSASRLVHIPLGPNIEPNRSESVDLRQVRAGYGAAEGDTVVAYFGFISPSKGIETLLHALARARRERPDLRLLLIASREPSEPSYTAYHRRITGMLNELDLNDVTYWTGYCSASQVSAFLASADMAVFPFSDGVSLRRTSLLTAMAHGLPVISTYVPNVTPSELGEEQGLRLVRAGDEQAMASAVIELASDRSQRSILSARAWNFASTLSWTRIARQTLSYYQQLLGG